MSHRNIFIKMFFYDSIIYTLQSSMSIPRFAAMKIAQSEECKNLTKTFLKHDPEIVQSLSFAFAFLNHLILLSFRANYVSTGT